MSTINERIKYIIDSMSGGNVSAFARTIGVPQPTMKDIVGGKMSKPGYDVLEKILSDKSLNISSSWLILEKGAMTTHDEMHADFVYSKDIEPKLSNLNNFNTVKEKIQQYIDNKGINTNEFERSIGVSKSYWRNTKNISAEVLSEIVRVYSDLSPEWLLLEKGKLLKDDDIPEISHTTGAPYYNVDFIGGFDLVLNDQTINPEYLINFRKYNNATCWCNVTGHSMEPEITHGDIIALRELEDWKTYIPSGEIYGIVTTEHRTIKKVSPSSKEGFITLIPSNKSPEFVTQDIPISIIVKMYRVLGCMKRL